MIEERKEQPKEQSNTTTDSSTSSRAPKKTCPACGAKVYISRTYCDECNHRFISKKEAAAIETRQNEKHSKVSSTTSRKTSKDKSDKPAKAIRNIIIGLLIYNLILVVIMAALVRSVSETWFAIISFGSILISLLFGVILGASCSTGYGKHPLSTCNLWCFLSLVAVLGADCLSFINWVPLYSEEMKWGIIGMIISISIGILASFLTLKSSLSDTYCPHCNVANVLSYSHSQNQKEIYAYKFKNHSSYTTTHTIDLHSGSGTNDYIHTQGTYTQTVPGYQENLGLHKKTTKEKVYICERCGRSQIQEESNVEKVDM